MRITRYFIKAEDPTVGEEGFIPLWVPRAAEFNRMNARGMMHDILEHRLCDTGKAHEEVLAFGRILALRVLPGVSIGVRGNGEEIFSMLRDQLHERDWTNLLPDPGPVRLGQYDADAKGFIHEIVADMRKAAAYEARECGNPQAIRMATEVCTRVARLLALGYKDAVRRYGGHSGCSHIGWSAFTWADRRETQQEIRYLLEEAYTEDLMRITVDTENGRVKTTLIRTEERHDWVRDRIRWWKTARV